MNIEIPPIIQVSELLKIFNNENVILIDVSNGKGARSNYVAKHLKGALFLDLNTQLAEIKEDLSNGGRHPLPKIDNFSKTLSEIGISLENHVIIYDDKNGSNAAARLWWMLKSFGHQKVQVVNGGFKEAEKLNFPMNKGVEVRRKTKLHEAKNWKLKTANIKEVESASLNENYIIIDVRDADRYKGKTEPIDLIAGHIPGAINIPFTENLDSDGLFLPSKDLKEKYEKVFKSCKAENIIIHCGSGVTACHTLLAIAYAGLEIPKLYIGSWSEWSRSENKIESEN